MKAFASTLEIIRSDKPSSNKPSSGMLIDIDSHSFSYKAVERLSRRLHIPTSELLPVIGITERTALRRQAEGRLKSDEADRLLRVARILEHAIETFGDADLAAGWLNEEIPFFDNARPLSLLDSDAGTQAVRDELGRIEYGDFA